MSVTNQVAGCIGKSQVAFLVLSLVFTYVNLENNCCIQKLFSIISVLCSNR